MWGLSDVKLRISIKIRDKSIWHMAPLFLLSSRGQYQGWNEQSEAMCCADKEAGAGGGLASDFFSVKLSWLKPQEEEVKDI